MLRRVQLLLPMAVILAFGAGPASAMTYNYIGQSLTSLTQTPNDPFPNGLAGGKISGSLTTSSTLAANLTNDLLYSETYSPLSGATNGNPWSIPGLTIFIDPILSDFQFSIAGILFSDFATGGRAAASSSIRVSTDDSGNIVSWVIDALLSSFQYSPRPGDGSLHIASTGDAATLPRGYDTDTGSNALAGAWTKTTPVTLSQQVPAPVPVPTGLPLLVGALAMLGGLAWMGRKRRAA